MSNQNIFITKETIRRLVKDVKDIQKNPLTEHGIYYTHNEDDILQGKALIIGPKNTPYKNGYYFFKFKVPPEYPHKPPKVTFMTNDGVTRFNPNLSFRKSMHIYIEHMEGPQTACQSISSILLSLYCVLNDSLLNEPGIYETHPDYYKYNEIITYKNYDVAIENVENKIIKEQFSNFMKL